MIYAGIDEAGYGPRLGPLCMGMCALRMPDAVCGQGEALPDIWAALPGEVSRSAGGLRHGLIPIADSKKLKLPNSGKRHPLTMLEPGVLALLELRGGIPADDLGLFERFGQGLAAQPRYAGEVNGLPVSTTREHIGLLSSRMRSGFEREGIGCVALSCATFTAEELNEQIGRLGSKSAASFRLIGRFLQALVERFPVGNKPERLRIVIDRQGGRIDYGNALLDVFPGATLRILAQGSAESVYELSDGRSGGAFAEVRFLCEAEEHHLPVAVASMTAKYVRELAMARFNAYFGSRLSELKPTAGYAMDAGRWLKDAAGILSPEERRAIVRVR